MQASTRLIHEGTCMDENASKKDVESGRLRRTVTGYGGGHWTTSNAHFPQEWTKKHRKHKVRTVACREVTTLAHEVRDHTVERRCLESEALLARAERTEVLGRLWFEDMAFGLK